MMEKLTDGWSKGIPSGVAVADARCEERTVLGEWKVVCELLEEVGGLDSVCDAGGFLEPGHG